MSLTGGARCGFREVKGVFYIGTFLDYSMRILVTADVHLTPENPERREALEDVVRIADEEDVDYLLIAGDMFDAEVDVGTVKNRLRDLFSDNAF